MDVIQLEHFLLTSVALLHKVLDKKRVMLLARTHFIKAGSAFYAGNMEDFEM